MVKVTLRRNWYSPSGKFYPRDGGIEDYTGPLEHLPSDALVDGEPRGDKRKAALAPVVPAEPAEPPSKAAGK